jgi:hypothetical protein
MNITYLGKPVYKSVRYSISDSISKPVSNSLYSSIRISVCTSMQYTIYKPVNNEIIIIRTQIFANI